MEVPMPAAMPAGVQWSKGIHEQCPSQCYLGTHEELRVTAQNLMAEFNNTLE